jgi:hypothetical protein
MYQVVHVSSGIIAVTYNSLQFALDWVADNNNLYDNEIQLYKVIKVKDIKNDGV